MSSKIKKIKVDELEIQGKDDKFDDVDNLTDDSDNDITDSDAEVTAYERKEADVETDEEDEEKVDKFCLVNILPNVAKIDFPFVLTIPSNVLNIGPSKSGKSTFVIDLIYNDRIVPRPEMVFMLIGGVSDDKIHAAKLDPYVRAIYKSYNLESDSIINPVSLTDLHEKLSKYDPKIPKLVILDDIMTKDKMDDQICEMATSTMHHHNCLVIYNYQNLFHKTSVILRENAETLIMWAVPNNRRLKNFFAQYSDVLTKYGPFSLSPRGQHSQDTISKIMEAKNLFVPEDLRLKNPLIIKRRRPGGRMVVYKGMFDDNPLVITGETETVINNEHLVESALKYLKKESENIDSEKTTDETGLTFIGPKAPCINADIEKLEDSVINKNDLKILERVRTARRSDL